MKAFQKTFAFTVILFFYFSRFAFAHVNPDDYNSFPSGFFHPLSGLDHILVMVAVGLWAVQLSGDAIWKIPIAFIFAMTIGFVLALNGVFLPFVEPVILASVSIIGLLIVVFLRLPTAIAVFVVAILAVFHGHAHGNEFNSISAFGYGFGFIAATTLLHGTGVIIAFGSDFLLGKLNRYCVTRISGFLTTLIGLYLIFTA
ncbi:MAG: urease accessory protein [Candidatus Tokpelaia sp. JSC188]|nr:MAG: urease accessory protein [Candidatus Tokpelaia sp. JSC188]